MNKLVQNIGGITLTGEEKKLNYSEKAHPSVNLSTEFWPALGSSPGLPDEYRGSCMLSSG